MAEETYDFKIESLSFRCNDQKDNSSFMPAALNVFIGPNNSGKSTALREIRDAILGEPSNSMYPSRQKIVIDDITLNVPHTLNEALSGKEPEEIAYVNQGSVWPRHYCSTGLRIDPQGFILRSANPNICFSSHDWKSQLNDCLQDASTHSPSSNESARRALSLLGPMYVNFSAPDDRLLLSVGEQNCGISSQANNTLSQLLRSDPSLERVSELTKRTFGKDVILDAMTAPPIIKIKVGENFDAYRSSTRSSTHELKTLESARSLEQEGDGLRSFTTVLLSLKANMKPVLLLDEPESFLHPPQARELGKIIADDAKSNPNKQIFVATHSQALLQGLIDRCDSNTSIIRLDRGAESASAQVIPPDKLRDFTHQSFYTPALLDGLFSKKPIITESPTDAMIFERICQILGIDHEIQFVPVNGKHAIAKTARFYKAVGITIKAIADFDLVNDRERLSDVAHALSDEDLTKTSKEIALELHNAASSYANATSSSDDPKKVKDLEKEQFKQLQNSKAFSKELLTSVGNVIAECFSKNLLILRDGELEASLEPNVEYSHTKAWPGKAMEYLSGCTSAKLLADHAIARDLKAFLANDE